MNTKKDFLIRKKLRELPVVKVDAEDEEEFEENESFDDEEEDPFPEDDDDMEAKQDEVPTKKKRGWSHRKYGKLNSLIDMHQSGNPRITYALGKYISILRLKKKLSQEDLAQDLSLDSRTLMLIETGKSKLNLAQVVAILDYLGKTLGDFYAYFTGDFKNTLDEYELNSLIVENEDFRREVFLMARKFRK